MTKCYFCRKKPSLLYMVKTNGGNVGCCSNCKFFYETASRWVDGNGTTVILKIVDFAIQKDRHCTNCKYININRDEKCSLDMWTGLGTHETEYPFSYANHGCRDYKKSE